MILAQMGMGLGLIEDCIRLIDSSTRTHAHVNRFLDDQSSELRAALEAARLETTRLAKLADAMPTDAAQAELTTAILRLRLAGGELTLRAAQAALRCRIPQVTPRALVQHGGLRRSQGEFAPGQTQT